MIIISKLDNLVGQQIDFLFVKGRAPDKIYSNGVHHVQYWCDCACGSKDILRSADNLHVKNRVHSCGCILKEQIHEVNLTHGDTCNRKINRLYRIWSLMKDRCLNSNNVHYKYYGGKGINICDDWTDYLLFREWAYSHGYQDNLTIDRINSDRDYCPENCRWIPLEQQSRNRSSCHYITINNEVHTITEWSKIYNISRRAIINRIKKGWSEEDAVTIPSRKRIINIILNKIISLIY